MIIIRVVKSKDKEKTKSQGVVRDNIDTKVLLDTTRKPDSLDVVCKVLNELANKADEFD